MKSAAIRMANFRINQFTMDTKPEKITTIDAYIANFPNEIQKLLQQMRQTIQRAAPEASEKISYQLPTFYLDGNLVHFAAYDHHIGFYPTPSGIEHFQAELVGYKQGKGSVQFPIDEPLPLTLIGKIVAFRVQENLAKATSKKAKKPRK